MHLILLAFSRGFHQDFGAGLSEARRDEWNGKTGCFGVLEELQHEWLRRKMPIRFLISTVDGAWGD
jgi:hypothetical protein